MEYSSETELADMSPLCIHEELTKAEFTQEGAFNWSIPIGKQGCRTSLVVTSYGFVHLRFAASRFVTLASKATLGEVLMLAKMNERLCIGDALDRWAKTGSR